MDTDIIARIRHRPELWIGAYPPALPDEIARTEEALGFALPALFKRLLSEVGNGGFGPLPGGFLGGLNGFHPDGNLVSSYALIRSEPETYPWPEQVVPVFDWGGACRCYLDCSLRNSPVIYCDPRGDRVYFAEDDPDGMGEPIFVDAVSSMVVEAPSLESWLEQWLDGVLTMGQGTTPWKPARWDLDIPNGPVVYFVRETEPELDL